MLQASIASSYAAASDADATMAPGKLTLTNIIAAPQNSLPFSYFCGEKIVLENVPLFKKIVLENVPLFKK